MRVNRFSVVLAEILVLVFAMPASAQQPGDCGYYVNRDGNRVPHPCGSSRTEVPPPGATAICRDGQYSYSQHHSGTCSGHGGVATWLR